MHVLGSLSRKYHIDLLAFDDHEWWVMRTQESPTYVREVVVDFSITSFFFTKLHKLFSKIYQDYIYKV